MRFSSLGKVFSLMGKWEKVILICLLALASVNLWLSVKNFYYAHTAPVPSQGGSYSEAFLGQPAYINPLLAHSEPDYSLVKLIFSGLYKYDQNGSLVPDLAEAMPQISDDQKQYTINIKKNAKWQNNKPLTADDVVFTIQLLQDPAYKSPLRAMWQSTTVEKLSDYSVKFTTKDVSGPFLQNLTLPILPKAVWSRVDAQSFLLSENNLKAIGSGPYAIKEIKKLPSGKVDEITFSAFDGYYQTPANIATLSAKFYDTEDDALNALRSREVQGYGFVSLGNSGKLTDNQNGLTTFSLPLPQYQVILFNLNNKILSDDSVRQALSLAVNRQEIINTVFNGKAVLPSSPLLIGQDAAPETPGADLAEASKLLDQAGWTVDQKTGIRAKKNQTLELTLATNDLPIDAKAADILAKQWQALNIKINLSVVSTKDLNDNAVKTRNFDILLIPEKFTADPDPFPFWHSSQIKDPGFNLTGFSDAGADKMISQARTTTDPKVRADLYKKIDDLIKQKHAQVLLDQTLYLYSLDNKIQNVSLKTIYEPSQRFYDLPSWYLETSRVWK